MPWRVQVLPEQGREVPGLELVPGLVLVLELVPGPGLPLRAPSMEESSSPDWVRGWSSQPSCMTTIKTQDPPALSKCPRAVMLGSKHAEREPL